VGANSAIARRLLARAWVRPEALNVTPDLLGMPLAPHGRRALALLADLGVVGVLSSTGVFWIAAGIAALVRQLLQPVPGRGRGRSALMWLTLAGLIVIGGQHVANYVQHRQDPPSAVADDAEDAAVERAATALIPAASAASDAQVRQILRAAAIGEAQSAARIASLEAQLAEARKPQPLRWRDQAVAAWHRLGRSFGWAVAYFTLLPFWWQGRTVGKWLFGLRIVELTGKPLGLMTCFGRYGGYAAGLVTGGMGFLQVLWDANRQAVQDKLAHTVVVDLRAPRAIAPAVAVAQRADAS
jgi:hypothetical protein